MLNRLLPLAICLLPALALSAEESPVVATRWVSHGYESCSAAEADFWVTVTWIVPHAVKGSKTICCKRSWRKVEDHADGSETELISGGIFATEGVCGDGPAGGSVQQIGIRADDNGPHVDLDLSWQIGTHSGEISRHFAVPWSELKQTIKDKEGTIYVRVFWPQRKPPHR